MTWSGRTHLKTVYDFMLAKERELNPGVEAEDVCLALAWMRDELVAKNPRTTMAAFEKAWVEKCAGSDWAKYARGFLIGYRDQLYPRLRALALSQLSDAELASLICRTDFAFSTEEKMALREKDLSEYCSRHPNRQRISDVKDGRL